MPQDDSPKAPPHRIDLEAKVRFLKGVRAGQARMDAAAGSGFGWQAFYQLRRRDPIYEFAWLAAMELSARDKADARRVAEQLRALAEDGTIEGQNRRLLQLKPNRGYRFDERRQQIFLDYFAGTADEHAAAEAAGVAYVTVRALIRRDPGFAALRDEALRMAYAVLEAESVRQRLAAQERLRDNLEPKGEMAQEFERVMKLLARYDRKGGGVASREHMASPSRAWSFEDAIKALDKALDSLGTRRAPFPPGLDDGSGNGRDGNGGGDGGGDG
ncbi:MAG TPA: hypothetical protein VE891_09970 [Allosphingosinicella sp.]|nr:hypothetical protein [Allosphingosinicella sp.]